LLKMIESPMVAKLVAYYLSLRFWERAPLAAIRSMQLKKFRKVFEQARKHSRFYREYYGDHGVADLMIESQEDICRVPLVNKTILRERAIDDIMTRSMKDEIHIHSTSGSSGEPFKIAFSRDEDYTSHVRVFWALRKAGFRMTDQIAMITRYNAEDTFEIERDLSALGLLQSKLNLFRRRIISIYEPVDGIIAKLIGLKSRILWSTPSLLQIVGNRLKEREIRLDFPIIFLTSEVVSAQQKELFASYLGKHIVGLYGTIESPSLGYDSGLTDRFVIFPNSNYFEFEPVQVDGFASEIGKVVITNLINHTMPLIRYELNDLAELDRDPGFGVTHINKIIGRQDDFIKLANGQYLTHHHAHEMFMDFHECEMFKFVQKKDQTVVLQLKIPRSRDSFAVEKSAHERWRKRFGDVSLTIEFVDSFKINPRTGKFKNIEVE
jgi:phenylacetate-CoA ligase